MAQLQSRPYEAGKLMFLMALTPIHAGSGRAYAEAVDLPIQKDEFGFPVIWGSGIKGSIRAMKTLGGSYDRNCLNAIFGPKEVTAGEEQSASSIVVFDARLLLIPARSLRGVYAYVTSPHLLSHLVNYAELIKSLSSKYNGDIEGLVSTTRKLIEEGKSLKEGEALTSSGDLIYKDHIVLNEMPFKARINEGLGGLLEDLALKIGIGGEGRRIVVVSDQDIHDIVRKSLVVLNRIRLNYETKTVARGGLWNEEYLPINTIMISGVLYSRPRQLRYYEVVYSMKCEGEQKSEDCNEIKKRLEKFSRCRSIDENSSDSVWNYINPGDALILGGHETIGKGIFKVKFV